MLIFIPHFPDIGAIIISYLSSYSIIESNVILSSFSRLNLQFDILNSHSPSKDPHSDIVSLSDFHFLLTR